MSDIAIIGSGYVGTVVAAALAALGNHVTAVEVDKAKLESLRAGEPPMYEPGLRELLAAATELGSLEFTSSLVDALDGARFAFLCLGTPEGDRGRPDMSAIQAVSREIGDHLDHDVIVVTKSTVPVGSNAEIKAIITERAATPVRVAMVSNPEFLRAGTAVSDFLHPDRIVLGSDDREALDAVAELYAPIVEQRPIAAALPHHEPGPPPAVVETDLVTAETIKYAANSFLAMKVSFINEIAHICDLIGADVVDVAHALGLDPRISPRFLRAGLGWGGSCFGKDLAALTATARDHGFEPNLLTAVATVNERQRSEVKRRLQTRLGSLRGRKIAIFGLAFKPGTDDTRDAPALDIAHQLADLGASVVAYDPLVTELPDEPAVSLAAGPYDAAQGADAVVLATEWRDFAALDFRKLGAAMRGRFVIDGRNAWDPTAVRDAGLEYEGIGRGGIARAVE